MVQGLTSETRLPQLSGQLRALLTALVGHLPQDLGETMGFMVFQMGFFVRETIKPMGVDFGFRWVLWFSRWGFPSIGGTLKVVGFCENPIRMDDDSGYPHGYGNHQIYVSVYPYGKKE